MGLLMTRHHKTYPLRRFQEWLLAHKFTRTTTATYLSCVRQALAAIEGDYANDARLHAYLEPLSLAKYRATVTGWRCFTEYLREQGKIAVELTRVRAGGEPPDDEGGEEGLDSAVRALREVYVWIMTQGRRIGAARLMRARFVERRGTAWVVQFGDEPPLVCSPKISPALNLLFHRAGRPADPRGCLVWPAAPGGDEECTVPEFKKLIGRLLHTVGGMPCNAIAPPEPQKQQQRIVIDPLPGMDGRW